MFDSELEKFIIGIAFFLWFANAWYLNVKLESVHKKLDLLSDDFNGLQRYLYEIDPQFDDERESRQRFYESLNSDSLSFDGMDDMELIKQKEKEGKRTLRSKFNDLY